MLTLERCWLGRLAGLGVVSPPKVTAPGQSAGRRRSGGYPPRNFEM